MMYRGSKFEYMHGDLGNDQQIQTWLTSYKIVHLHDQYY